MGRTSPACAWKLGTRLVAAGIVSGLAPADRVRRELNWLHRLSSVLVRRDKLVNQVLGIAGLERPAPSGVIIRSMCLVAPWGDRKILSQPEVQRIQMDGIIEAFRQGAQGTAAELALFSRPWGFDAKGIKNACTCGMERSMAIVPVEMGRYLADHIPHCQARFIPGAGHLWIFEGYEEVFRALIGEDKGRRTE